MTFSLMCKLLQEGTRTCAELAEETGLHKLTVYDWVAALHKQKVIHICMWEGEGRKATRVFMLGSGRDAAKPTKPRAKVRAEYHARKAAQKLNQRMAGDIHASSAPRANFRKDLGRQA